MPVDWSGITLAGDGHDRSPAGPRGARRQRDRRRTRRRRPTRSARRSRRRRWRSPTSSPRGTSVAAHARQRPAGRQPAGQERPRARRGAARAARLVRRADAGDARVPDRHRAGGRAAGARDRADRQHGDHPRAGQPRRPGVGAADEADRALAAARPRRASGSRPASAGRRAASAAGDGSCRRPSRWRSSTRRPSRSSWAAGAVVVAGGGGGIPMVRDDGTLRGVEAVLDKDLTGALLARTIGADCFVIATDVEAAAIRFGTPEQEWLGEVSAGAAARARRRGALRERQHGAEGRRGAALRRAGRPPGRDHVARARARGRRGHRRDDRAGVMTERVIVRRGAYHDSVTLMLVSREAAAEDGADTVVGRRWRRRSTSS